MKRIITILFLFSFDLFAQSYKDHPATELIINSNVENASHSLTLLSPNTLGTSLTFTLPPNMGTNGQVLTTDGSGSLTWTTKSGLRSPVGIDGSVQFYNSGAFGSSSSFIYDASNTFLGIGSSSPSVNLHVSGTMSVGKDGRSGAIYFTSIGSSGKHIVFQGSATNTVIYTLPDNDGEANQALITNGSASLSWGGGLRDGPTSSDTPNNISVDGNASNGYAGGGANNSIQNNANNATLYGGTGQTLNQADNASIMGGKDNTIDNNADQSLILGGELNGIINNINDSGIFTGYSNDLNNSPYYSWIGAGSNNLVDGNSQSAALIAGANNSVQNSGARSFNGGGQNHNVQGPDDAVLSGNNNDLGTSAGRFVIFGGRDNTGARTNSFIGSGFNNDVSDDYSLVLAGANNNTSDEYVNILGGVSNNVTTANNTLFGSGISISKSNCVALGRNISIARDGKFIFKDNTTGTLSASNSINNWEALFVNGYNFYTNSTLTTGVYLDADDTAWNSVSDSTLKELILKQDPKIVLDKLRQMQVYSWVYKDQDDKSRRKYGPMAQDFFRLFGQDEFGTFMNQTSYNVHDLSSIFLLGVQGAALENEELNEKVEEVLSEQEKQLDKLQSLEERLKSIEKKLNEY